MKTTITISNDLANELNRLKYLYGLKTIEEVILRNIKLNKEVTKNEKTK